MNENLDSPEAEKRLYKSTFKFGSFVFPNGHKADFKGGMFATDNPYYIQELDKEIAGGHPQMYIDPNARTITASQENPMLALKRKFYEEFQAELQANLNPKNDMGTSEQSKLNAASTTSIAPVALGGDGTSTSARLIALAGK